MMEWNNLEFWRAIGITPFWKVSSIGCWWSVWHRELCEEWLQSLNARCTFFRAIEDAERIVRLEWSNADEGHSSHLFLRFYCMNCISFETRYGDLLSPGNRNAGRKRIMHSFRIFLCTFSMHSWRSPWWPRINSRSCFLHIWAGWSLQHVPFWLAVTLHPASHFLRPIGASSFLFFRAGSRDAWVGVLLAALAAGLVQFRTEFFQELLTLGSKNADGGIFVFELFSDISVRFSFNPFSFIPRKTVAKINMNEYQTLGQEGFSHWVMFIKHLLFIFVDTWRR